MSHEVEIMAYVGKVPWHGLGAMLPPGQDLETWTKAAGLAWTVERGVVRFYQERPAAAPSDGMSWASPEPDLVEFPARDVLYRSDTGAPLEVVSQGYQVVQPAEVMQFFSKVTAAAGLKMESAGCLKGGRVYWSLARTDLESNGGDRTLAYVLLATSCDKSLATVARHTTVRVVCANTLEMATAKHGGFRVSHSSKFDADEARAHLGLDTIAETWADFELSMARLQDKPVSEKLATLFYTNLLRPGLLTDRDEMPGEITETETAEALADVLARNEEQLTENGGPRGLERVLESYHRAPGAAPGSAYGLVQGMTHYLDHVRGADADKRLASAWFGQGRALKARTVDAAGAL